MAKIKIDTFYDIRCDICGLSRAVDIGGGLGFETDKGRIQRLAYKEGWCSRDGKTLCPECAKKRRFEIQRKVGSPRSHMLYPCSLKDLKLKKNARRTRENLPDGTTRLYCYGYTDSRYDGNVFLPECANCPNNVIFAQEEYDRLSDALGG